MKKIYWLILIVTVLAAFVVYDVKYNYVDWRTADRSSAGIAPLPEDEPEAVVQVYAARTYNWRKYFAVHSWIATKEKNADSYTVYQVVGFYLWSRGTALDIRQDIPDRRWYAAEPVLLKDLRGEKAEQAIEKIKTVVTDYPYSKEYHAYPGPNSNTFISYILRQVPELDVDLPPTAIGKDFLGYDKFATVSESNTGWQVGYRGLIGLSLGKVEGLEINILGLNFGIDVLRPAIKLPFVGRIGMERK